MTTITHTSHDALAVAARTGDDRALRLLVERFRPMVRAMARERFIPGGDHDDLVQEGMVGLWHAIRDFDQTAGPFGPFARLCVDRQMWAAVTKANRYRHRVLHDASVYEDWMDIAVTEEDPAVISDSMESVEMLQRHIRATLSSLETQVLQMYAAGASYDDIADRLEMHRKRIDNALQRARRKISEYRDRELALV